MDSFACYLGFLLLSPSEEVEIPESIQIMIFPKQINRIHSFRIVKVQARTVYLRLKYFCALKTAVSKSFDTDGCINTNACANTVSHLSEGKTIEDAWEITPEDVIEFLETLPEENYHSGSGFGVKVALPG